MRRTSYAIVAKYITHFLQSHSSSAISDIDMADRQNSLGILLFLCFYVKFYLQQDIFVYLFLQLTVPVLCSMVREFSSSTSSSDKKEGELFLHRSGPQLPLSWAEKEKSLLYVHHPKI